ncbi:hypothetical protein P6B95_30790 [Streptomyces atratus]|uniref:hypothetical protein n=1 Tax=Streptomyces atratus TaxID=1893 RepID=UPI0016713BED|nr:hypothetical protein [Streptomyces atratus]WPW31339.1 hypothetical protein P6B95_30790 [Streptomyces atratus]GGT07435.1 hypothetical protein GCM10010207_02240 [Streptomyces atratus]
MPETTPNSKGPAKVQLPTEATEPVLIPASEVKPEDIATLSVEYRDGQPVLIANGGKHIPAGLTVMDGAGNAVAAYAAEALQSRRREHNEEVIYIAWSYR